MKTLDILNVIFCFIFFIEFLLKLIGLGICGYFKNPWNCLDFLIVTVSTAFLLSFNRSKVIDSPFFYYYSYKNTFTMHINNMKKSKTKIRIQSSSVKLLIHLISMFLVSL